MTESQDINLNKGNSTRVPGGINAFKIKMRKVITEAHTVTMVPEDDRDSRYIDIVNSANQPATQFGFGVNDWNIGKDVYVNVAQDAPSRINMRCICTTPYFVDYEGNLREEYDTFAFNIVGLSEGWNGTIAGAYNNAFNTAGVNAKFNGDLVYQTPTVTQNGNITVGWVSPSLANAMVRNYWTSSTKYFRAIALKVVDDLGNINYYSQVPNPSISFAATIGRRYTIYIAVGLGAVPASLYTTAQPINMYVAIPGAAQVNSPASAQAQAIIVQEVGVTGRFALDTIITNFTWPPYDPLQPVKTYTVSASSAQQPNLLLNTWVEAIGFAYYNVANAPGNYNVVAPSTYSTTDGNPINTTVTTNYQVSTSPPIGIPIGGTVCQYGKDIGWKVKYGAINVDDSVVPFLAYSRTTAKVVRVA